MQFLPSEGVEMVVLDLSKGSSFTVYTASYLFSSDLFIIFDFPNGYLPKQQVGIFSLAISHAKPFPACARKFRHLPLELRVVVN
jgi:hypothetical protein